MSFQSSVSLFSAFPSANKYSEFAVHNFRITTSTMAERCSVCGEWIKTSGGPHICPGSNKANDNIPAIFNIDDDEEAPLLYVAASV